MIGHIYVIRDRAKYLHQICNLKIGPKTGSAGGKNCKLTTTDELVLDIIGWQSPIVQGLGVQDSLGHHTHETILECTNENVVANDVNFNQSNSPDTSTINIIRNSSPNDNVKNIEKSKKRVVVASSSKQYNNMDELTALERRKLELQVEWLEKQNYKETLEILQLENKLLLEHSKYTFDLVLEHKTGK
ncbi:uncharacterized protein LOC112691345 [Sipha flava]|uniref:Uncharacterized protein LOC112691345 n=1 Tax=Sipha flava TaxID=143950 RepID=A0A8B8GEC8_9HEMI|nr:uncharacterized protein LOC112691345 [Sipha flava]